MAKGWLDNYGKQENYNDSNTSVPKGYEGEGYSMKGRNYSPAWGGQFQEGGEISMAQKGKKVKYVESKNDPRYKAYQDSLSLYNKGYNATKDAIKDFGNKNISYNKAVGFTGPIKPSRLITVESDDKKEVLYNYPVYKKPQQQVIVKDNNAPQYKTIHTGEGEGRFEPIQRQPIQGIQNNLQPSGLVQGDFNIDADAEIHPEVRRAKYYDVKSQRQTINGPSDYYNYDQQGLSVEQATEAMRAADAYNQSIQDKYGNSKNPKAQERLKQLRQDVELTPNYQMGGSVYPVNYVPQAQEGKELTFLQPTSDKLPEGYRIPYSDPSTERAGTIGGENGEPAYLVPNFKYGHPIYDPVDEFRKTGEHLGGPFKTWQEADKWESETRHPAVEKGETIIFPQEKFAMGGTIAGAPGFSYARTQGAAPSKGPHRNKVDVTDASAQNGKEMQYYQNGLDWQPKTISKNGSWLSKYDKAQDGDILDKFRESHPSIRSIQNDAMNRKIQQSKGRGKETTVTQKDNTRTVTPKIGKIATDKEKEQRAIEENKQAQEASELQARKDWVQGNMEEVYKSPLMSPGYFTPEGAAIGALQGAFKMPGHIAEGDYKGAAIDALMALPIGIPAAKRLGRALGPEEGLIGKVSNELNINTSLSKIKKEGQLQGLSDYEIAKKQMEQVGITSNQRKGYTPIVSELAEKYITPYGYTGTNNGTKLSQTINNIKQGGVDINKIDPERLDAWKLYLGRPQVHKTFGIADTAPAIHPSYKPGSLEGMDIYNINSKRVLGDIPEYPSGVSRGRFMDILENPIAVDRERRIMGGYNKVMTKEGTQYNDVWDLDPHLNLKDVVPNKISGNTLLENIFYKTNAQGMQSPRGVTVPVSKVFGKPFMSHGNLPYSSTHYVDDLKLALQGEIESLRPIEHTAWEGPERIKAWEQQIENLKNYPKFEEGGIIKDDRGQWGEHKGEPTRINQSEPGSYIDMGPDPLTDEPLTQPLLGISDKGERKIMYPGEKHKYKKGTKYVDEFPMAKNGLRQEQKGLENLDQLTNFTNYNKPTVGGWLNKYN
jgi:hypothetical protein